MSRFDEMNPASPITLWPENERPRERILKQGKESLSDAELLALLLRSGIYGKGVMELSRDLLSSLGGFRGLLSSDVARLQSIRGLGPAKIAALLAIAEIIRRYLREDLIGKQHTVHDPESVMAYLYASMRDLKIEVFKVLFLDKANHIIDEVSLFHGTVDQTAVHPREVIKAALERHATSVILVHNHPSGRTQPSVEDRAMTSRLQTACAAVGIKVMDHLIIGNNQFFSFAEQRLI